MAQIDLDNFDTEDSRAILKSEHVTLCTLKGPRESSAYASGILFFYCYDLVFKILMIFYCLVPKHAL